MYKNSFVHYLTKVLVDIMFYGGILCCIAVPFIMPALTKFFGYKEETVIPLTIMLISSGICAVFILWQLKAMFKTLLGGNPFVYKNVNCFRRCSVASFLIAMIYITKLTFWFTIASCIITIIFALLGLFCLTLKDLFKQAVAYKEENDWTV
ncbi:MAG: DUF2975 domain-containing protein [Oscillospiraceae bacterium]|nr:DUF2975 domain-containing protein [Oscillospiraceae bacterium]